MNNKKRITIIFMITGAVLLVLFLFIYSKRRISSETIQNHQHTGFVTGVNETIPRYCMAENGFLYAKNHNIWYYDMETAEDYILCDEINCTHLTKNCSAYYADGTAMSGLALYGDKVYLFDKNAADHAYEFIQMDTAGNDRKILARFEIGDFQNESWYLEQISEVYYCGKEAWAAFNYTYVDKTGETFDCIQWIGIDLNNGKITELVPRNIQEEKYEIVAISQDYLVFQKTWKDETGKAKNEFGFMESYFSYKIETGEWSLLEEDEKKIQYNEDGSFLGTLPKYLFAGEYEEDFLCYEANWDEQKEKRKETLFIWKMEDNTRHEVCTLEGTSLLALGQGNVPNLAFEGSKLLGIQYEDEKTAQICLLDLKSQEKKILFEDTPNVTFRIEGGATKDSFVGAVYDFSDEEHMVKQIYRIKKEDYYQGNFDNMILLDTIRW